mmetsp:Transcript_115639/g.359275  ORF Transcript_115639/g.359275 Transcript_115639/m.359275 type:complete len:109 (-) Transcript_115639:18-344(-)
MTRFIRLSRISILLSSSTASFSCFRSVPTAVSLWPFRRPRPLSLLLLLRLFLLSLLLRLGLFFRRFFFFGSSMLKEGPFGLEKLREQEERGERAGGGGGGGARGAGGG